MISKVFQTISKLANGLPLFSVQLVDSTELTGKEKEIEKLSGIIRRMTDDITVERSTEDDTLEFVFEGNHGTTTLKAKGLPGEKPRFFLIDNRGIRRLTWRNWVGVAFHHGAKTELDTRILKNWIAVRRSF